MHQFKYDIPWRELLHRFCTGQVTFTDIDAINERLVDPNQKLQKISNMQVILIMIEMPLMLHCSNSDINT